MDVAGGEGLANDVVQEPWDGRGTKKALGAVHKAAPLFRGGRP